MRREQRVARVDEVVAEQDRERLVADVLRGAQDGVPEAERVALAYVVHGGQLGAEPDRRQAASSLPLAASASSSS